ncbi:MAG: DUF2341 domain-containing protein [Acidobacterium ailaaui]|nr:DUF2341 domain-containing protein [Pseudacidobacterium ailaaui]
MKRNLIFAIALCIVVLRPAHAQNAAWMDPAWLYRNPVTINNSSGNVLSQFQVNINLGSETNFSAAKSDGSDLRVTASDGVTQLPFWIESWNAASSKASIWVKVPNLPTTGTTLFIYYGNPNAATASNGNNVFEFFDDFETPYGTQTGYFAQSSPTTVMVQDQTWEANPPHTLSVVQANQNGYTYSGYYGTYQCDGIGIAYSNDLTHWTKYTGNPLISGGRWPTVQLVNGVYYMLYEKNFCTSSSYIELATSTDGLHFTDVKPIVKAQSGLRNQNPNLFFNPNDNLWYLYYYHGDDSSNFNIYVRSASSITALDTAATSTVLSSKAKMAAPSMFYYNGKYYLSTEGTDPTQQWVTNVYSSSSPKSGFTLVPGNPVLANGGACMFQQAFGSTLYNYNCQQTNGVWTLQLRTASLSAGPQAFGTFNPSKWKVSGGGVWAIVPATQPDGTQGHVAQAQTSSRQVLVTSNYSAGDYVVQASGREILGDVWGVGVHATAWSNLYSVNLYGDMNGGYNLYSYGWFNNTSDIANMQVLQLQAGNIQPNTWYKIVTKVHQGTIEVDTNGQSAQGSSSTLATGGVALYAEAGSNAEWDNLLVRKYAVVDPTASVGQATQAGISSLTVSPSSVLGGATSQGTVTLAIAAPAGGAVVSLSSTSSSASVPASVTVPAGATSASFQITTTSVATTTSATISATYGSSGQTAILSINPYLSSVSISPSTVQGGSPSQGTVTLYAPAPSGGATITLSSGNSVAAVPASIMIPAGQTSGVFTINTSAVNTTTAAQITASYSGASVSSTLTIQPPLSSFVIAPSSILAGATTQGTITLGSPAPSTGATVSLSSNNAAASVPSAVTVPAGASSANFTISGGPTAVSVLATITASYMGSTQTASITVLPVLASLSLSQNNIFGGNTTQGTVTLNGAAPSGGTVVNLSSDNSAASVPATVTIAAGATSATFTVTTTTVSANTTANIIASSLGSSSTASLTIAPASGNWFSPSWQYRSAVTITNSNGSTLSNFQVKVQLGSNFDFTKAAANGADIRFTASDGLTAIPFWIESWNSTSAVLWVNVPSIPTTGTTIFMYYGNPSATTASNGPATFLFFDDFSEGNINSSNWTASGGTWSVVSDTNENGVMSSVAQGITTNRQILYSTYSGTNYVADVFGKQTAGRVWGLGVRATNGSNLYSINLYDDLNGGTNLYAYSWVNNSGGNATATLGGGNAGTITANTWNRLTAKVHGNVIDILANNVPVVSVTDSSNALPSGGIALYGETGSTAEFENVLVRQYAATEPATSVGPITTQGGGTIGGGGGNARVYRICLTQAEVNGGAASPATCTLPSGVTVPAGHGVVVFVSFPSTTTIATNAVSDTEGNTYTYLTTQQDEGTADTIWAWSSVLKNPLNAGDIITLVPPQFWGAWNLYIYDIGPVTATDTYAADPLYYNTSWTLGPTSATTGTKDVCIGAAGVNQVPTPPISDFSVTNNFTLLDVTNFHNPQSANYPGKNLVTMWGEVPSGTQASTTLTSTIGPDTGAAILGCWIEASTTQQSQTQAKLQLQPSAVNFPATVIGNTTPTQTVTVANVGNSSATLQSSTVSGDFTISGNTCGTSVAPSASCTVAVAFAPKLSGTRTGTLSIQDAEGSHLVALSGNGLTQATADLSASMLTFPSPVIVGNKSTAQVLTLTNNGDASLEQVAVSLSGDFTMDNGCAPQLAGHTSCPVSVTFVPTHSGVEEGVLQVSTVFGAQEVRLSGTGLSPPLLSLSSTLSGFGGQGINTTSSPQQITLVNNGGAPVTALSFTISGDFAVASNTCPAGSSLAVSSSCILGITFTPTQTGSRTGMLTVSGANLASSLVVPLQGTGVDFLLAVIGQSSQILTSGQAANYQLQFTFVGASNDKPSFTCSGLPKNTICTVQQLGSAAASANGQTFNAVVSIGPQSTARSFETTAFSLAVFLPLLTGLKRRRYLMRTMLFCLVSGILLASLACGIQPGSFTAPAELQAGTYTVQIHATLDGLTKSVPVTLIVR